MKRISYIEFLVLTSSLISSIFGGEPAWQRLDKSEVNCNFNEGDQPFCEWKPASVDSADLWKTGNAVIVDSVNSITKSADGDDHFAYVQGEYGAPSKGSLESPEIFPGKQSKVFKFAYWKTASTPILDVCVKDSSGYNIDCIDSFSGPGQQQWIRKSVTLPKMQTSYRIVLRARSIHSAEDIIGVDDLQLMDALPTEQMIVQQQPKRYPSLMAASQRHYSPTEEPSTEMSLPDSEASPRQAEPPLETKHVENPLMPLKMNKFGMSPSLGSAVMPTKPETLFPPLPNFTAPAAPAAAFPDFPSFPQGFLPGSLPATNNKLEQQEMCRAVKCSFLEGTCEWTLGPTWKRSDGNIAMEIGGEDTVISAPFKAPLGSYIEFDLWMSDDSFFTVMEVMDSMDVILFTRQGMSNNGWHRFRIPLRPSFSPVQIKLKNALPPGGFITLSNTRLVNGNGEEVSCETVYGSLVTMPPLFPPMPNLMAPPTMLKLRDINNGDLQKGASAFGGNIFEGVKPIEPMKDDPQRLTAFQGYNPKMLISTTPEPFLLSSFPKSEFPVIDASNNFHQQQMALIGGFGLPTMQQQKPVAIVSTSNSKGDLLSQLGAHPSVEKELRQLASRFGFDTNKIPDPTTLNMIKRFLGPKIPLNFGTKIAEFSSNIANNNNNGISQNLRPIKPVNVDSEDFERVYKEESLKRMFSPSSSSALSSSSSSLTASSEAEAAKAALNGELLKSFASVIQLPSNSPDPQLPFRQKNLDFAYQNALSSARHKLK